MLLFQNKVHVVFEFSHTGGGAIFPKVFCQKNSAILANSAISGTPFVLGAYITGIILAKNGDFA
jgi:hypothetical protein